MEVSAITEPGRRAMTDEDARPMANLADLLAARRKDGAGEPDKE